jgi:hypothetical protein
VRHLKKDIWPYQIFIKLEFGWITSVEELTSIDTWCTQNVGNRFREWYSYNLDGGTKIYAFKDEATLLVFKLRWSEYVVK